MELIGYLLSGLIGISLGLMGAGGSILTVPLLVYFFNIDSIQAARYSLFIVGVSSASAMIPKIKRKEILMLQGSLFSIISLLVVCVIRRFITPQIPAVVWHSEKIYLTYSSLSMILFSILMLYASVLMLKREKIKCGKILKPINEFVLFGTAIFTGLVTGFLGAGGGFIIVPALILFFNMEIRKAIGTSLFIIVINSCAGFLSEIDQQSTDWTLILNITCISLIGSFIGNKISLQVDTMRLKIYFGWLIILMAICILSTQLNNVYNLS
ncbi:MAG: sulfite exporter TauE/SafE family protein [Chryseobacterium sp.]|jgi:uncharacterized membrane protein YfcA|uniref:sulfite exporter TauE/SafE family protein n=1 Tax=Pedobacter sp. Leaf41 TaxID=1736218 RepID=UPI0007025598|nr:sulfite exporter TauE/SafE family protein [Pedobacter sp. Leaf41]KQN36144.1 hypothetical protein ASE92_08415 [Pedobacter sp. Leaf41]RZJ90723.1 MAG: sulfite exporter TauE/SafE family protein [Chryseobacterium sp.]